MHVGLFIEEARPGVTAADGYREIIELVDAAEALGLDGVWLGEIHFNPSRSFLSAPLVVAAAIAARTRRVRVGTAVQVIPLDHPLRIAEEAATVDQISRGRLELGVGRSGAPRAYDVLGIPYGESQARFREALEVIREAWTGKPFSHHGEFYRFDNAAVSPPPYQVPHPPLRMAANSAETFPVVADLGLPIFVGLRDLAIPELRGHLATYRRAWGGAGHAGPPSVYLRIPLYAAPTEREAIEDARASITHYFRRQAEMMRGPAGRAGAGPAERRHSRADALAAMTYDEILATRVAFGTAAGLVERLSGLRDELGLDGVVVEPNSGGLVPADRVARSLRILAREVLPALRRA
jgi:alkanesulfonate monooxygenase SsuD/methylene tetrahydromethanopterin reductase-like flavin-dependent oxidoreductase (luciferase family)